MMSFLPEYWLARLTEVALQVTLWLTLGLLIMTLLHRHQSMLKKRILLAVFSGVFLLTILSLFQPLWRVSGFLVHPTGSVEEASGSQPNISITVQDSELMPEQLIRWFKGFFSAEAAVLSTESRAATRSSIPWRESLACLLLACTGYFVLRLLLGLWFIQWCYRRSKPIQDHILLSTMNDLKNSMGVHKRVSVCELPELSGPATAGWRHCLILLPSTWRVWTTDELRCVLAHELAHVHATDFLTNLFVQINRALHGYHPLVHLLTRQLLNHLEVLADARAAHHVGQARYIKSLCQLALRPMPGKVRPPALAFASPLSLSRRMTMLNSPLKGTYVPRPVGWLLASLLLGSLIVIAGLRSAQPSLADDPKPIASAEGKKAVAEPTASSSLAEIDLRFISPDADGIVAYRPSLACTLPWFNQHVDFFETMFQESIKLILNRELPSLKVTMIDQAVFSLRIQAKTRQRSGYLDEYSPVIRLRNGTTWQHILNKDWPDLKPKHHAGKAYYPLPDEIGRLIGVRKNPIATIVDEQTLILGSEETVKHVLAGTFTSSKFPWSKSDLAQFHNSWAFFAFNLPKVRQLVAISPDEFQAQILKPYDPVWKQADTFMIGLMAEPKVVTKIMASKSSQPLEVNGAFHAAMGQAHLDLLRQLKVSEQSLALVKEPIVSSRTSQVEPAMPSMILKPSQLIYQTRPVMDYAELMNHIPVRAASNDAQKQQFENQIIICETTREEIKKLGLAVYDPNSPGQAFVQTSASNPVVLPQISAIQAMTLKEVEKLDMTLKSNPRLTTLCTPRVIANNDQEAVIGFDADGKTITSHISVKITNSLDPTTNKMTSALKCALGHEEVVTMKIPLEGDQSAYVITTPLKQGDKVCLIINKVKKLESK